MGKNNRFGTLVGTGVISAFAASLCCITPVFALIAGSSGVASSFSWLEPARPYLITASVFVLGFAWYQKFKAQKKKKECACDLKKPSFWQSKIFLSAVTIFSVAVILFPYYAKAFLREPEKQLRLTNEDHYAKVIFKIEGMGCEACEHEIDAILLKQEAVFSASTSYEKGESEVKFDSIKTSKENLVAIIEEETGYKATPEK